MKKTKEENWGKWFMKYLSSTGGSVIGASQAYADQVQSEVIPSDEEIKQSFCDQLEGILRGVKLKNFCTGEDDALPLIDHLCQTGSKDITSGMEEIENIVEQIYFEFNIDNFKSQLKPADPVQRLKDKGLIERVCAMDEINKICDKAESEIIINKLR